MAHLVQDEHGTSRSAILGSNLPLNLPIINARAHVYQHLKGPGIYKTMNHLFLVFRCATAAIAWKRLVTVYQCLPGVHTRHQHASTDSTPFCIDSVSND